MRSETAERKVRGRGYGQMYAGAAAVDITPPVGTLMCGYAARKEGARGVHDPLFARALVLTNGETSIALVAADLVWLYSRRIVEEARKRWSVDHVILCGSHTHSGPRESAAEWYAGMEEKVIAAIGRAKASMFSATVDAAAGPVNPRFFGYNRRYVRGRKVQMWWNDSARKLNGPTDPLVRVIRVCDKDGRLRVVLAHHAAHAVTLGSGNLFISSDYPGTMTARLESALGRGTTAMFLQGAGGDVHPYDTVLSGRAGFRAVARNGNALAGDVLDVLARMPPPSSRRGSLRVRRRFVTVRQLHGTRKNIRTAVTVVLINDDIALAAISGEPFVRHQLDLSVKSPLKNTLLLGYSYCGAGAPLRTYLPDRRSALEGGYGASRSACSVLEVGAGEKLTAVAAALIDELVKGSSKG